MQDSEYVSAVAPYYFKCHMVRSIHYGISGDQILTRVPVRSAKPFGCKLQQPMSLGFESKKPARVKRGKDGGWVSAPHKDILEKSEMFIKSCSQLQYHIDAFALSAMTDGGISLLPPGHA